MNSFINFETLHGQLGKLAREMKVIAELLYGCAGLIDALADCETANLGLETGEAFAVRVISISRRLNAYAAIWKAGAKHIASPSLPVEEAGLEREAIRHARVWMAAEENQRVETGELFECYAEYLQPCIQALRLIENRYSESLAGTDEARTFNALYFIFDELEVLASDIEPLIRQVWNAWNAMSGQIQEGE